MGEARRRRLVAVAGKGPFGAEVRPTRRPRSLQALTLLLPRDDPEGVVTIARLKAAHEAWNATCRTDGHPEKQVANLTDFVRDGLIYQGLETFWTAKRDYDASTRLVVMPSEVATRPGGVLNPLAAQGRR